VTPFPRGPAVRGNSQRGPSRIELIHQQTPNLTTQDNFAGRIGNAPVREPESSRARDIPQGHQDTNQLLCICLFVHTAGDRSLLLLFSISKIRLRGWVVWNHRRSWWSGPSSFVPQLLPAPHRISRFVLLGIQGALPLAAALAFCSLSFLLLPLCSFSFSRGTLYKYLFATSANHTFLALFECH
jgi:hypothetical protein